MRAPCYIATYARKSIICIISFGIFIVTVLLMIEINLKKIIEKIKNEVVVVIYLKENINKKGIEIFNKTLLNMDENLIIKYISKEEAFRSFKETLPVELSQKLTSSIDNNPLPSYFMLYFHNHSPYLISEKIKLLCKRVEKEWANFVDEILCSWQLINFIDKTTNIVRISFPIIYIVISLWLAFIIFTLFKLGLVKEYSTIKVLKINGASEEAIKLSYIREGFKEAFLGVTLGLAMSFLFYKFILFFLNKLEITKFTPIFLPENIWLYVIIISIIIINFLKYIAINIAINRSRSGVVV